MIFKEKFKIGLKDIGKENKVTNKAILEYLENIASYHSDSVGFGVNTTNNTMITWVLLDWKLKVLKRPQYGQVLEIHTWARYTKKCYSYRDFELYNENQELMAIATSKWALIDLNKGRITKIEDELIGKYKPEKEKSVFSIIELDKLNKPDEYETSITYETKRKDIDMNGHMHNLYYLELAYEALPNEIYDKRPFDNVRIMYKKEIKFGDIVKCKYSANTNKQIVTIVSDDESLLHAIIELS